MITIEQIKNVASDIISDEEWVNDLATANEHKGVKSGLEQLINHFEELEDNSPVMLTKEQTIIRDNALLIANFEGYKTENESTYGNIFYSEDNQRTAIDTAYHNDWNWLMAVVKKIETLSYVRGRHYFLQMEQAYVQFRIDRMNINLFSKWGTSSNARKIRAVYDAVVEFIKWYNENISKNQNTSKG